jgi:hypothetical protein
MSGREANEHHPEGSDAAGRDLHMINAVERELQPALERATETLQSALSEACSVNVNRIDTGQLIRVEEVLAIANEAAKEAISVRRRARGEHEPGDGGTSRSDAASPAPDGTSSRILIESTGRQWTVFAVRPSAPRGRSVLRPGYADGWLSFDAGDETRRVAPIPQGWERLSDSALLSLCAEAEPARPRGRSNDVRMRDQRPHGSDG